MLEKTVKFIVAAGLFLLGCSLGIAAVPSSVSGTISATARVEQPIGMMTISSLGEEQELLQAPASSELQIEIETDNSSDRYFCPASQLKSFQAAETQKTDISAAPADIAIITIIILNQ